MTRLIRVKKETYEMLHKTAGRIQAKTGKRVSLDAVIQYLLAEKKRKPNKEETEKPVPEASKEPLKWFSLHHRDFKHEKEGLGEEKEQKKQGKKRAKTEETGKKQQKTSESSTTVEQT